MGLLVISFIAGVLTVLAPCILPVLPVVIGRSVSGINKYKPVIVTASLAVTVIVFTLILKASTVLINIPPYVWSYISGGTIILFGLTTLSPGLWEKVSSRFHFARKSNEMLRKAMNKEGVLGDVFLGLALGPVFSSCSPTYFLILATVLPQSYTTGIVYLAAYAVGLSLALLFVSYAGQKVVSRFNLLSDTRGVFKRTLGVLFILVGIFVVTGTDKKIQTWVLDTGFLDVTKLEQRLLVKPMEKEMVSAGLTLESKAAQYPKYSEIVNPAGFINTDSIQIGDLIGKKVILVDFMTYSCINCIRTFPYLNAWYEKYKDQGLEIIGIHTPEFAFEHKRDNVLDALSDFGIKFPVVLDNEYATWRAYGNNYWPHKYLIDIDGYIVYDHIGEGGYDVTEKKIQELLKEKAMRDSTGTDISTGIVQPTGIQRTAARSPEIYFGFARNKNLGSGIASKAGEQSLTIPKQVLLNKLYMSGTWNFEEEFASPESKNSRVVFRYDANAIYVVAQAKTATRVEVLRDGKPLSKELAGADIMFDASGKSYLQIQDERLYSMISNDTDASEHELQLIIEDPSGIALYTFTFG